MTTGSAEVTARCMKCKETKPMKNIEKITMKNGRPARKGVCPDCGTKMFRIGASDVTGGARKKSKKAVSKKTVSKKSKKKVASKKKSKKAVSKKSKKSASKKRKSTKKKTKVTTLDMLAGW